MIVDTEKVLREADGPVRRVETSVKSAQRVERWSPWGAPQKPSHRAGEEPEDH